MLPIAGTVALSVCAATGGWLDLSSRRLPNWLCGLTALAGLAFVGAQFGLEAAGWAALHAVGALLVGMVLFRLGMIGGGDAKFYAACAAWFLPAKALTLLLYVSLAGLILVIVWFGYKRATRTPDLTPDRYALVPYGLAIAVGAVATRLALA